MIKQAVDDRKLIDDPFPRRLKWPRWRVPPADPFSAEERSRIIAWFRKKQYVSHSRQVPRASYPAFAHCLFWAGLRPSEAAGLQWQDVDLEGARLHVQRSRHLYEYGAPKTLSADRRPLGRVVPRDRARPRLFAATALDARDARVHNDPGSTASPSNRRRSLHATGTRASEPSTSGCEASTVRRIRSSRRASTSGCGSRGWRVRRESATRPYDGTMGSGCRLKGRANWRSSRRRSRAFHASGDEQHKAAESQSEKTCEEGDLNPKTATYSRGFSWLRWSGVVTCGRQLCLPGTISGAVRERRGARDAAGFPAEGAALATG